MNDLPASTPERDRWISVDDIQPGAVTNRNPASIIRYALQAIGPEARQEISRGTGRGLEVRQSFISQLVQDGALTFINPTGPWTESLIIQGGNADRLQR